MPAGIAKTPGDTPLLGGYIKIEQRTNANPNVWVDITNEILALWDHGPEHFDSERRGRERWNTFPARCAPPSPVPS